MKNPELIRYFRLHPRLALFILLVVSGVIAVVIFFIGHESLFIEFGISLSLIALFLFVFMAIGLYHGVRVLKDTKEIPEVKVGGGWDWLYFFDIGSLPSIEPVHVDIPSLDASGDDLAGCLISILIWIGVTVLVAVILAVVVPFIGSVIVVFFATLYWIFYQALRQVFARSRYCRGNWARALGVSFIFTLLYTSWLYALILGRALLPVFLK